MISRYLISMTFNHCAPKLKCNIQIDIDVGWMVLQMCEEQTDRQSYLYFCCFETLLVKCQISVEININITLQCISVIK